MNTNALIFIVATVIAVVAVILLLMRKRSERLRNRFGPEYDRALQETGSKYRAESKLEELEKRVEKFSIHPLEPEVANRFRDSWQVIQSKFVDDPKGALNDADWLVGEVMSTMGYPVNEFEQRVQEISVHHVSVVENYRIAHEISERNAQGQATTEEMRQAMIHYRTLFDELVGEAPRAMAKQAGSRA